MPNLRDLEIILIIAFCTFLTRIFPFAVFGRGQTPSPIVKFLGKSLPGAVIAILVIYCIKTINFLEINTFVPQFIAIALVVILHLWKRNNLLSIGCGTVCFMILVQTVFK